MSNKAYHDFILEKLNAVITTEDDAVFGGEFLWSYLDGELKVDVPEPFGPMIAMKLGDFI